MNVRRTHWQCASIFRIPGYATAFETDLVYGGVGGWFWGLYLNYFESRALKYHSGEFSKAGSVSLRRIWSPFGANFCFIARHTYLHMTEIEIRSFVRIAKASQRKMNPSDTSRLLRKPVETAVLVKMLIQFNRCQHFDAQSRHLSNKEESWITWHVICFTPSPER